jgi:hypothetical protein
MKSENALCGLSIAVVLQFGLLAGSAQTNIYLFNGTETNITLNPGTYIITAYGAPGGTNKFGTDNSLGAEMSAEFNFSTSTTLTLLVGGGGGYFSPGGGGSWYNSSDAGGGGGGGSIIDSSAITILAEVSGIASPDDSTNGEIIIIAVPPPLAIATDAAFGFTNGVFGFNVTGPSGSNMVIQASTDLQTWFPLQTNQLGSGPLYFSDSQSPANVQRFYRAQISP